VEHPAANATAIRNKRTILREAEASSFALGMTRDPGEIVDMVHLIERSAMHFFRRAVEGKRKQADIDADYLQAAHLAALVAPYRHARLSAMKLAGDPNSPHRIKDDATADELRAEVMSHIARLSDAGILDLAALPAPKRPVPS
jgi:hypothetical protein